jgi:hypothetical protein
MKLISEARKIKKVNQMPRMAGFSEKSYQQYKNEKAYRKFQ